MNDIICLSVDGESDAGSALVKKYDVRVYPTLLFLDADGSPRDAIRGYVPREEFHAEVKRIKSGDGTIAGLRHELERTPGALDQHFALIEKLQCFNLTEDVEQQKLRIISLVKAGKGFETRDVNSRWALSQNLRGVGLVDLADEQVRVIRELDPQGKSLPMRRLAFARLASSVREAEDLPPLMAFLEQETYTEILFDGWYLVYGMHDRSSNKTRDNGKSCRARTLARQAAVELWKHTPAKHHATIGNQLAWGFYEDDGKLNDHEKAWALQVAEIAMQAANRDVNVIDTYACCLFINGQVSEALTQMDRCIELDPKNKIWRERREQFSGRQD